MAALESVSLTVSIYILALSILVSIIGMASHKSKTSWDTAGLVLADLALALITLSILARWIITGHGPFSNMYEFGVAFSWGVTLMGIIFHYRYRTPMVRVIGIAIALILLIYASNVSSKVVPLVPALQQSLLLTVHVACAIISYGAFAVGFASAVLLLIQSKNAKSWLPTTDILDDMSYRTSIVGFPFLTLTIILGALWADIAWGRYWGWDPKETASLVTWLFYAVYLHVRVMRGWRGSKSAIFMLIGFLAVIFTFLGNYIFSGLHAYQ